MKLQRLFIYISYVLAKNSRETWNLQFTRFFKEGLEFHLFAIYCLLEEFQRSVNTNTKLILVVITISFYLF